MTTRHPPTVRLAAGADNQTPHHWIQGPQDVTRRRLAHNGRKCEWVMYWYLDRVEGTGRRAAAAAINAVIKHPQSWERSGLAFVRTYKRDKAHVLVSVIPADKTACGQGAAGCYSWDGVSTPAAELGVEYLGRPEWAELVNMELGGHAAFRMSDMYAGAGHDAASYVGVMGTWGGAAKSSYYPSDAEIADAAGWLIGRARFVEPGE